MPLPFENGSLNHMSDMITPNFEGKGFPAILHAAHEEKTHRS
jgi:hypothetical protein